MWRIATMNAAARITSREPVFVSRVACNSETVLRLSGTEPRILSRGLNYVSDRCIRLVFNSTCECFCTTAVLAVDGRPQLEGISAACTRENQNRNPYRGDA